ncbi:MAG: tripartite tricarboxylate transporter substrate binding protein [Betaproteobacteria bacterium]|jgi:tripartite-type tricarboxylate transporter receptor subunit TctC|nr:tripartite tricarboxylate transporter substrate binding protein [Betaproteobacteria bacterium]
MKPSRPGPLVAAIAAAVFSTTAAAFPTKPIRIVVAYTPAGTTDILARVVGQRMSEAWGQPVIVDNRPGANGNIGTEVAARAVPDGHSLVMATAGTHGINVSLYRKLAWHPVKDFAPVSLVAMVPNIMVVNNALPVKSVKEFIAYARANPGKLSYGSPGLGSTAHMSMELFKSMTGSNVVHVPYKGSAGVLNDVMGGQIAVTIDNMPPYVPQVRAGKIRALAVSTAKRSSAMPDLPSIAEAGVPGYDAGAWFGLLAPAGTPRAVVDKLSAETARILKLPEVSKRISELGAEPVGGTPEQFAAFIKSEIDKWAKVIKDANVELQ